MQLLGEPGGRLLERAFLALEPGEDRLERFLLLGHLGVQPAKLLFERQPALVIGQRLHELERGDRAGEMILQVARQRIGRHRGIADQGAKGTRSPRAILSVAMRGWRPAVAAATCSHAWTRVCAAGNSMGSMPGSVPLSQTSGRLGALIVAI